RRLRTRSGIAIASATSTTPAITYSMGKSRFERPGNPKLPPCWTCTEPVAAALTTHWLTPPGHESAGLGPWHEPVAAKLIVMACVASLPGTTWNVTFCVAPGATVACWSPVVIFQPGVVVVALTVTASVLTELPLATGTETSPPAPPGA